MREFEFKSGKNHNNLEEEVVVEVGKEDFPLRRSVGMPAFSSEAEKDKYMEDRELAAEKKDLEKKILRILSSIFMAHAGKPSLAEAIKKGLLENVHLPEENIRVSVDKHFLGYKVDIAHPKYGDLEFDFTD
jgi:hypothetical protein